MIITISGDPGSGKSTVAKTLSEKLNYERFYMGKIHRELARKKGIDLNKHVEQCKNNPDADKEVDDFQKTLATKDEIIVEGRTSFHFIPKSLKIFFKVDLTIGALRIIRDVNEHPGVRNEVIDPNLHHEVKKVRLREKEDRERYQNLYGIDILDMNNYDIVIDSSDMTKQQQIDETLKQLKEHGLIF